MNWRIHRAIVKDRIEELQTLLSSMGEAYDIIEGPMPPIHGLLDVDTIAMTSLQDAKSLVRSNQFLGRIWFNTSLDYAPSTALANWSSDVPCINENSVFVPAAMLAKGFLPCGSYFIKANNGSKQIIGQTIHIERAADWSLLYKTDWSRRVEPSTMIQVSPAHMLDPVEWRFWIVDGKVVSSSPYSWDGDMPWSEAPEPAMAIAKKIASHHWQPDSAFVVDIVSENGVYFFNELNAASTSGVYQAPLKPLFESLRRLWLDERNIEM